MIKHLKSLSRNAHSLFFALALVLLNGQAVFAADFARAPDATINTVSLFDLPKDIISIPVLKDLLTEDFVFYYRESGADWLSFRGALARLAYEQKSDWPTKMIAWLLNGPAEVALWKADDGKLSHFMVVIDQSGVKELMKILIQAAANDSQLSRIAAETPGAPSVQTHKLTLSNGRTIFWASEENRLFVFSDIGIPIPVAASGRSVLDRTKSFFGVSEAIGLYGPKLGTSQHSVTVAASYLTFGYQAFLQGLKALRFDFNKGSGWEVKALSTDGLKAVDAKDWAQMPRGAAFCLAAPIAAKKVAEIVKASAWLDKASGSAVACWYPESKFYTPLIALQGDYTELIKKPAELKQVFSRLIGSREVVWVRGAAEGEASTLKWLPILPVKDVKTAAGQVGFTREVGGRYGLYPAKNSQDAKRLGSLRFFRTKLVATSTSLVFSPDDQLVDRALTTLSGKFPSMVASLPASGKTASFILAPEPFAKLAKQSILDTLPQAREEIFRTAVSRHLFPNLERFAKRPLQAATIGGGTSWRKVEWTSNAAR